MNKLMCSLKNAFWYVIIMLAGQGYFVAVPKLFPKLEPLYFWLGFVGLGLILYFLISAIRQKLRF